MEIREMCGDDYENVYRLWLSCQGMGLNDLDDSKEGIERFLERNPQTCFVVIKDHNIVGAIMAGHDGRRGYIYHTCVHPHYRREGIGEMMVDRVMEVMETLGINKVALVVFQRNKDGQCFWEKMGFSTREDIVYRNKAIKMMKRMDT